MENKVDVQEKIKNLEEKLEDLKKRWPAHSLKPEMFAQLETLEEQIELFKEMIKNNE